jgi:hypothetical protein
MNCAFPITGSIAALASSRPGGPRSAELSIVSILDGEIGNPITWIDEPEGAPADHASRREMPLFEAVAEDIGAHLPTGVILVHRPDFVFTLLRRVLPRWRPTLMVDVQSLAQYAQPSADSRHGAGRVTANPSAEVGLGTTAERAVATARLLLRFAVAPEDDRINCGLELAECPHHFL